MQCHDDSDEEHPLAGMHPNEAGEDQEAEMAQAIDDSIDVAIIAEANIAKGNKSIECVLARVVSLMFLGQAHQHLAGCWFCAFGISTHDTCTATSGDAGRF